MEILFKTESTISDEWVEYIAMEALALAETSNELAIENYADREVLNPQMAGFLESDEVSEFIKDEIDDTFEPLTLNATASVAAAKRGIGLFHFRRLKRKIRRLFCQITADMGELNIKDIIKKLLVALIPAFGLGVPAIILPIVVALAASLLKLGYDAVCPV